MSKDFSLIPIDHLLRWILTEEKDRGEIFGIHQDLFFKPKQDDPFRFMRYGKLLETPLGVAAGPHSQMAQNIIAAWLCGGRYIELKTVQTLDELTVSKPCIDMGDEGYNCEWSQELRLHDSFSEYLNAWIILHILLDKWDLGKDKQPGFLFNMSVGYNMEGILKPNVQEFFAKMKDCRKEKEEKIAALKHLYPRVTELDIPDCMSDNITLSTMHGCPPDEIEKIGKYLIEQMKLHTTIKLNPTLLGPEELRGILNDELRFETIVPDEAFGHDLKYPDAVKLIQNLRKSAEKSSVHFSLKLTNTLESLNHKDVFPPNEKMMYMSGRALHPISVRVARKLQREFNGELDLSFSAGADCWNLHELAAANIKPVTVCSDILKPGGYARLTQYLDELRTRMREAGAANYDEFALKTAKGTDGNVKKAALGNLEKYAEGVTANPAYKKDSRKGDSIKMNRPLTAFDCVKAPCVGTCPANQDIPAYLYHVAKGNDAEAMRVIHLTNPLPNIAGLVCDHLCQTKCTRLNYEQPLLIREIKRFVTERQKGQLPPKPPAKTGLKAAIIGAGPSGLSCAYFLAHAGFEVTIFETKAFAGGMASDAIPEFRLTAAAIEKDIKHIESLGVKIVYDHPIDKNRFNELVKDNDYVYLAIGAQKAKPMGVPGEHAAGCIDFLRFLSDVRRGKKVDLGKKVVVIGAGNSAMDVARTAYRLVGKTGEVTVVYRRTRKEMPADREEIEALLAEGIKIMELTAPAEVKIEGGKAKALHCQQMKLGEKDASGRRKPVRVEGGDFDIPVDTIIPAIGQDTDLAFLDNPDLKTDPVTNLTRIAKVYAGGDLVRGASSLIKAVGDGKSAAQNILKAASREHPLKAPKADKGFSLPEMQTKRARRVRGFEIPEIHGEARRSFKLVNLPLDEKTARAEASRCLYCDDYCGVCVTVCPNRANLAYQVATGDYPTFTVIAGIAGPVLKQSGTMRIEQSYQFLNVGDFCNECGNCTTFCPTKGAPFMDKPKFYLTEKSFNHESDGYRLVDGKLVARVKSQVETLVSAGGVLKYESPSVQAVLDAKTLTVTEATLKGAHEADLTHAVRMGLMFNALQKAHFG